MIRDLFNIAGYVIPDKDDVVINPGPAPDLRLSYCSHPPLSSLLSSCISNPPLNNSLQIFHRMFYQLYASIWATRQCISRPFVIIHQSALTPILWYLT